MTTEYMPDDLFQDLVAGVEEMVAIENGRAVPNSARVHTWEVVDVKRVRNSINVNQRQFADLLGVKHDAVRSWEGGRRNPSGAACKLLGLLDKQPELALELT